MPEAIESYLDNIHYLEKEWTEKEIKTFIGLVESKINLLEKFPTLGRKTFTKKSVYKTLVHRRILLFYKVKPRLRKIELLSFWNTSRDTLSNKLLP